MSEKKDFEMTRAAFRETVDRWHRCAIDNGVALPGGEAITSTFFKVMLGVKRRVFQEWYQGKKHVWLDSNGIRIKVVKELVDGNIPNYVTRTIYFIERLSTHDFIKEVKKCIPMYLETKQD